MKIGELARVTGTKAETIRYYEGIGLLPEPRRTSGNYRDYGPNDLERLNFIRQARGLGFDIDDIRSLLELAEQRLGDRAETERVATGHLIAVERKIAQLEQLRAELKRVTDEGGDDQALNGGLMKALSDADADKTDPSLRRAKDAIG
jgi:DNA-binding transcriptional MerR regulator